MASTKHLTNNWRQQLKMKITNWRPVSVIKSHNATQRLILRKNRFPTAKIDQPLKKRIELGRAPDRIEVRIFKNGNFYSDLKTFHDLAKVWEQRVLC